MPFVTWHVSRVPGPNPTQLGDFFVMSSKYFVMLQLTKSDLDSFVPFCHRFGQIWQINALLEPPHRPPGKEETTAISKKSAAMWMTLHQHSPICSQQKNIAAWKEKTPSKKGLIPSPLAAHLELLRWGSELQIDAMFRLVKGHGSRGVKGEPNETCLSLQQDMEMDKSHACSKALRRLHPFTHVGFSLCEVGRCHGSVVIITVRRSWNQHLPIGRSHARWLHTFHVKSPTATSIS